MRILGKILILMTVFLLLPGLSFAAPSEPLSRQEFQALAEELAPKVNLFAEVWRVDPNAQFLGGTTRDYLYWLKGQLGEAAKAGRMDQKIQELRSMELIDVRKFILYQSDIDVISQRAGAVNVERFGIKKLDLIDATRFDPASAAGQDEIKQGYIPAEKIRLGRRGFVDGGVFGDGLGEIYSSRPTVHFASDADFQSTRFAQMHLNHPSLLALRYIRILAMDYFQNHGKTRPDPRVLLSRIDPEMSRQVKQVIDASMTDPRLGQAMAQPKFKQWFNLGIQKAFRSYTNPTATMMLFKEFGADRLASVFPGLEPINQFLFSADHDEALKRSMIAKYSVNEASFYETPAQHFPEGKIYHGTRDELAFRSILFQGILPSESGSAGGGLYGVAKANVQFAIDWGKDENRVVEIGLSPTAKIVDVTKGEGARVFRQFAASLSARADVESAFAEAFGVDIIRYPYSTDAYVVKNGAVLAGVNGYKRKLMSLVEMIDVIAKHKSDASFDFISMIIDNALNAEEIAWVEKKTGLISLLDGAIFAKTPITTERFEALYRIVKAGYADEDEMRPRLGALIKRLDVRLEEASLSDATRALLRQQGFNTASKAEGNIEALLVALANDGEIMRESAAIAVLELVDRERRLGNAWAWRLAASDKLLATLPFAVEALPDSDPRKSSFAAFILANTVGNNSSAAYGRKLFLQKVNIDPIDTALIEFERTLPSRYAIVGGSGQLPAQMVAMHIADWRERGFDRNPAFKARMWSFLEGYAKNKELVHLLSVFQPFHDLLFESAQGDFGRMRVLRQVFGTDRGAAARPAFRDYAQTRSCKALFH